MKINLQKIKNLLFIFVFTLISFNCYVLKTKNFTLGLDFTGGTLIEIQFNNTNKAIFVINKIENYTNVKSSVKFYDNIVNMNIATSEMESLIKEKNNFDVKNFIVNAIDKIIQDNQIKDFNYEIIKIDSIGPSISKTFIKDSILALLFAISGIFIYILIRFDYKFAFAGILAILFDIFIASGFVSYMNIELNLTLVTAFLTIIGYCINDKIVVFDRIRTNLILKYPINIIINLSLSEVLIRSILTSFATSIATISLLFFDDIAIKNFGLTVVVGIITGTFSSIFISSNLLLLLRLKKPVLINKIKNPMFYNN